MQRSKVLMLLFKKFPSEISYFIRQRAWHSMQGDALRKKSEKLVGCFYAKIKTIKSSQNANCGLLKLLIMLR